jgi:excisionase family DNA binding protein
MTIIVVMRPIEQTTESLSCGFDEAARRLGLGLTKFKEMVKRGEIPTFRVGGRRLVAISELRRFVDERVARAEQV